MYALTLDCQALGKHPCIIWLRLSFTIKNIPKHYDITIVYLQSSRVRNKPDIFSCLLLDVWSITIRNSKILKSMLTEQKIST